MQLAEFASLVHGAKLSGDGRTPISGIRIDSRKVMPGDLFICVPGLVNDGHRFAGQAKQMGAAALVVERDVDVDLPKIFVKDARFAMAVFAAHFYGYPSRELKLIGVTGTNGKTTTAMLIEQMLRDCGMRTGLMGTVGTKIGDGWFEAERTTMDAVDLQMNLRRMADIGTDFCVMEVSSHALELGRVKGCRFRTALFTNLTQDHLDFHVTMERYKAAKGLLFARLGNEFEADPDKRRYAVLNKDDPASDDFSRMTSAEVVTYGFGDGADVRASGVSVTPKGTRFSCSAFGRQIDVAMKLIGKFNVSNALAALSAVLLEGVPLERAARALESAAGAPGRMEMVDEGQPFLVVVDYAHTPDGLENALATIREFARGRVITVFGCGGERDRTKRPLMGGIAARLSDIVVVTSDNPRSEPEEVIIDDIESGIPEEKRDPSRYARIADRKAAIKRAIEWASEDDVVLIAGKGHETYQVIGGVNIPFDDREVAKEAIRGIRP